MINGADVLLTVAEIGVAFAAFSGLVAVLGRADDRTDQRIILPAVLLTALLATGFALFPFLPDWFGLPPHITWRISAGLFAMCWTVYLVWGVRGARLRRRDGKDFRATRMSPIHGGLYILGVLGLLGCAFGLLPDHIRGVYLSGLFVLLLVSGSLFVSLFLSLTNRH